MGDNLDAVDLGSGLVVAMSAGNDHTCVVFSDGRLKVRRLEQYGSSKKSRLRDRNYRKDLDGVSPLLGTWSQCFD